MYTKDREINGANQTKPKEQEATEGRTAAGHLVDHGADSMGRRSCRGRRISLAPASGGRPPSSVVERVVAVCNQTDNRNNIDGLMRRWESFSATEQVVAGTRPIRTKDKGAKCCGWCVEILRRHPPPDGRWLLHFGRAGSSGQLSDARQLLQQTGRAKGFEFADDVQQWQRNPVDDLQRQPPGDSPRHTQPTQDVKLTVRAMYPIGSG